MTSQARALRSRTVVLRDRNIDTDRIIPARFLTTTGRTGLGRHAFNDWRVRADGSIRHIRARVAPFVVDGGEAVLGHGGVSGCTAVALDRALVTDADKAPVADALV